MFGKLLHFLGVMYPWHLGTQDCSTGLGLLGSTERREEKGSKCLIACYVWIILGFLSIKKKNERKNKTDPSF